MPHESGRVSHGCWRVWRRIEGSDLRLAKHRSRTPVDDPPQSIKPPEEEVQRVFTHILDTGILADAHALPQPERLGCGFSCLPLTSCVEEHHVPDFLYTATRLSLASATPLQVTPLELFMPP